jgi:hypothetical protein
VDGVQLLDLCAVSSDQPAYLVTYANAPNGAPRQMTVALASDTPRVCRVSAI